MNKKQTLRIGTFLAILMFLLVPLLSSPVAASFNWGLGNVWTNNTPAGPTAGGTIAGPGATLFDTAPFNAQFNVDYSYTDTQSGPRGSDHWVIIIVWWQPAGAGPWSGPNTYTQGRITLTPGTSASGTFTTGTIVGYGGKGTNFVVTVTVNCQDLNTMTTASWTSPANAVVFTIV